MHFYYHMHIVGDTVIVHSHIHIDPQHNPKDIEHADNDITLIAQASTTDYVYYSCDYSICPLQLQLNCDKFIETTHCVASIYFQNLSLRAPPIV